MDIALLSISQFCDAALVRLEGKIVLGGEILQGANQFRIRVRPDVHQFRHARVSGEEGGRAVSKYDRLLADLSLNPATHTEHAQLAADHFVLALLHGAEARGGEAEQVPLGRSDLVLVVYEGRICLIKDYESAFRHRDLLSRQAVEALNVDAVVPVLALHQRDSLLLGDHHLGLVVYKLDGVYILSRFEQRGDE